MKIMTTGARIDAFKKLGEFFSDYEFSPGSDERDGNIGIMDMACRKAFAANAWFTSENLNMAIRSLGEMLHDNNLKKWVSSYNIPEKEHGKKVAVIMAGNIPLVGFHDFLSVLVSGNNFLGKLSSDDKFLLPAVSQILISFEEDFKSRITFSENRIEGFDAVIATGSNNTAGYFEYYFSKYPNIIRKNRNGVAVLTGFETDDDLKLLADDIFTYFGRGCRNVSKLYVPEDYNLIKMADHFAGHAAIFHHNKYNNNYTFQKSILMLNSVPFTDTGYLIMKEDERISSPVGMIFYEKYKSNEDITLKLTGHNDEIQCVVSVGDFEFKKFRPGEAQHPELTDYADGVDTMQFLLSL